MSTSDCPRCGTRYRNDHTCADLEALDCLQMAFEKNTACLASIADKLDQIVATLSERQEQEK